MLGVKQKKEASSRRLGRDLPGPASFLSRARERFLDVSHFREAAGVKQLRPKPREWAGRCVMGLKDVRRAAKATTELARGVPPVPEKARLVSLRSLGTALERQSVKKPRKERAGGKVKMPQGAA